MTARSLRSLRAALAILPFGCGTSTPSQQATWPAAGPTDAAVEGGGASDAPASATVDASDGAAGDASTPPPPDEADAPSALRPLPFVIDAPNVVRRSNIVLHHANSSAKEFLGLGNGTLGAAVWAANGLTAQLNRGDTFPDRKAVGQLVVPGLAPLTSASDFSAYLDLYDATLHESGGGMTATVYIRADAPEMIIDVTGADPNAMQTAKIGLWSGRASAASASAGTAVLSETWVDSSGMGASGQTFGVLAGLTAGGRNVAASVVDARTVQVSFQPNADGSFRVIVAAPAWTGGNASSSASSTLASDPGAASGALAANHLGWWHSYWGRVGLIEANSSDGSATYFENLRTLYLYYSAAQNRGAYPGSQAGLADLFDYLQDTQPWLPAAYWFWNLRMQVAANLTSGALDMNAPVFHLYQSNLANIQSWTAAKMGGKTGICVPETMRFNGNGYWYGGEGNASCDQAASPSYNALTLTSGAEVALWIWQHYLFTQDETFLSTNYPVMSQAAKFLLAYSTPGSDGLLHTTANAHETQWDVTDPITDIVAMRALFQAVVSAAAILGTDPSLATQLQAALSKLPPLPRTDAATHQQLLTASDDAAGKDVFAISYQPSAMKHNGENLDLEAVWPYGLVGDSGPDSDLAKRTYSSRMFVNGADWSFDAVDAARLGLGAEVANALHRSAQTYQSFVNGLALLGGGTNDGTSEPYVEELGIVATAMNEAFVQDYDGLLRWTPALPPGWDAAGTIFIQGRSKVDFQTKGGNLALAIVEAGSTGSIEVRNPWSGQPAAVIDGSTGTTVVSSTSSASFSVPTTAGHWYAVQPGTATGTVPEVQITGTPASQARTLGSVSIGL